MQWRFWKTVWWGTLYGDHSVNRQTDRMTDLLTDRHSWKHYLPATSSTDGKILKINFMDWVLDILLFQSILFWWYSGENRAQKSDDIVFCFFANQCPVLKITTWRSRSSQIAGSSTQQLLLCNNATFDDIILQHLMTSFWMTCTFWILNKQVKNSFLKLCTIFHRSSLDLDLD